MKNQNKVVQKASNRDQKLGLFVIITTLLVIGLIIGLLSFDNFQKQKQTIVAEGMHLARLLSGIPSQDFISEKGQSSILKVIDLRIRQSHLAYVALVDLNENPLAVVTEPGLIIPQSPTNYEKSLWISQYPTSSSTNTQTFQEFRAPLLSSGTLIGSIRIGYAEPRFGLHIEKLSFLAEVALLIFLLAPVFYYLAKRELTPIHQISDQIDRLAANQSIREEWSLSNSGQERLIEKFGDFVRLLDQRFNHLESENKRTKATNQVLSYQNRKSEVVLEAIPFGVILLNEEGMATFANQKIESLLEAAPEQIVDQAPQSWCNNASLIGLLEKYHGNVNPLQRSDSLEFSLETKPERMLEVSVHPLSQPNSFNQVQGTLVLFRDISKEVEARQARDEFVGHVAHELKAPLNIIRMFVDLMLDDTELSNEKRIESLNSINDQSERLSGLISNLLSITKIESGTLSLDQQRVNLKEFLQDTFNNFSNSGHASNLHFELKLPNTLNAVSIDKELFRIALNNLLSNAVKYNKPGGTVTLEAEEHETDITIRVRDTGVGIDPEDCSRIFEKFYRSENQEILEKNGHGLGLALAQQITEIHHGSISVHSEKGAGTEFVIQIEKVLNPLKQVV